MKRVFPALGGRRWNNSVLSEYLCEMIRVVVSVHHARTICDVLQVASDQAILLAMADARFANGSRAISGRMLNMPRLSVTV